MGTINEAVGSVMCIKGGAVSTFIYRSKESGMWQQHTFGSNEEFQAWNDGSPPFPGWWNANFNPSDANALDLWRWWDGERWSVAYRGNGSMDFNVEAAEQSFKLYDAIKWNDRWPDGARVPRMIPDGYENFEVLRGICGGLDLPSTQLVLPLDDAKTLQQKLEESDW